MEIDAKEKTALGSSVGADEGQSNQKSTLESIPVSDEKINETDEKSKLSMRERALLRQKMMAPEYLPTITLQTLFDMAYQSKPPVIEGLLYTGTWAVQTVPLYSKRKNEPREQPRWMRLVGISRTSGSTWCGMKNG